MKVLFCNDGSATADEAVRFGALIAAASRAECSILGITEKTGQEDAHLLALRRAQEILKAHQLDAELIAKSGRLLPEIVKRTRETHYDLVVIGASRKTSSGLLGMSAHAYRILESVGSPVLVVIGRRQELRRMLLTTTGSARAQPTLNFAAAIAKDLKAAVTLLHIVPEPPPVFAGLIPGERDPERLLASNSRLGLTLRQQVDAIARLGVPCEFRLRDGWVVPEITAELAQGDYDLVVAGCSPTEDRLRGYVMGDVTREILNRAELPVLVVPSASVSPWRRLRALIKGWFSPGGTAPSQGPAATQTSICHGCRVGTPF